MTPNLSVEPTASGLRPPSSGGSPQTLIYQVAGVENIPLRTFLLQGVARFTVAVGGLPEVTRIGLVGSLVTQKALHQRTPTCS